MKSAEEYPGSYLYRRIVSAKLFIDRHYAAHLDLNNIAGKAFFSKFHFIRLFRKIYGCTPHQYLVSVRIAEAKKLLSEGKPAARVCAEVGFESLGSFADLFKRTTGSTPMAYQLDCKTRMQKVANAPLNVVPHCFARANGWLP